MSALRYRRVLIKLSGESLAGEGSGGWNSALLRQFAGELATLQRAGAQVGLVVGGGNLCRGSELALAGVERPTADGIGMLATLMNALAMQDALGKQGVAAHVLSALPVATLCEPFNRQRALALLAQGEIVLCAAGTGNPLFTTDTAASLRAIELGAELLIKATKVEGIYTADPRKDPQAVLLPRLSYADALQRELGVMDLTALVLCRDHHLPLRVLDIFSPGNLLRVLRGEAVGSLVE